MTNLTDMQLVLLTTACQRADGSLLPAPESLGKQPARIRKAVETLIKKGLAAESEGMATERSWRTDGDFVVGVVITDAGGAIVNPPAASGAGSNERTDGKGGGEAAPPSLRPTKQSMVLDLLKREGGATLADIVEATEWLPHTSRAALTGLRKKGHEISSTKMDGVTRYQIAVAA